MLARDFVLNESLENADILCVFQVFQTAQSGQKIRQQLNEKIVPAKIARTIKFTVVPPWFAAYAASKRFNGRTRGCLPVDNPAPRPCSPVSLVPISTNQGSLTVFRRILFFSLPLLYYNVCIIAFPPAFCQGKFRFRSQILRLLLKFAKKSYFPLTVFPKWW